MKRADIKTGAVLLASRTDDLYVYCKVTVLDAGRWIMRYGKPVESLDATGVKVRVENKYESWMGCQPNPRFTPYEDVLPLRQLRGDFETLHAERVAQSRMAKAEEIERKRRKAIGHDLRVNLRRRLDALNLTMVGLEVNYRTGNVEATVPAAELLALILAAECRIPHGWQPLVEEAKSYVEHYYEPVTPGETLEPR